MGDDVENKSDIRYLGVDQVYEQIVITYVIDGDKFEYYMDVAYRRGFDGLLQRGFMRALNYAKKHASYVEKNGERVEDE